jgi:tripartite-type tricarboxylate transporter receptor subunit TctC
MRFAHQATTALLGIALLGAASTSATAADFYAGKTITLICGSTPGGIYDIYTRLLGRFMGEHIPGKPQIVIQNMPGASGLTAANHIANLAAKDGTVFANSLSSTPTAHLMSPDQAKFDAAKLTWIGSITTDPYIGYVMTTAPAQTYEDMKKIETFMGGNSVGAAGVDMAILSNALFGTKLKVVTGYPGSAEVKLALEKGEIHGTFANSWGDLKAQRMDWIQEKKVKIFIQHGVTRHRDLPDVPLIRDQAKTDEDKQVLNYMLARQEFSKPFFGPAEIPADRLNILRRAFDATMKDPKFLEEVAKARLVVDGPLTGEELTKMVIEVAATPIPVVKKVEKILADFNAGKK